MYVALAAKSEPCLSASLHEYDVRSSHALDEQLRRPPYLRDQRIRLDLKLVHVLGLALDAPLLAELNVIARDCVSPDIGFGPIRVPVKGLVERERVTVIRRQVEARGELPLLLESRSLTCVHVGTRQARRDRIVSRAPAGACHKRGDGE